MDNKARSSKELLSKYSWAILVAVLLIAALAFLLSQAPVQTKCTMLPATGALTYVSHSVTSSGDFNLLLKNDSNLTIQNLEVSFSGDFNGAVQDLNLVYLATDQVSIAKKAVVANPVPEQIYNGIVSITYDINGTRKISVANCTGQIN